MGLIPGADLLDPKLIKTVLIVGAVGVGAYFIYDAVKQGHQDDAQNNLDNSPEAQQANNFLKLLHPYSYKSFNVLTTLTNPLSLINIARDVAAITDKAAIVAASKGVKNFDLVSKYYKELTRDALNLPDDIRSTLNDGQQKEFFRNISVSVNTKEVKADPFYIYANPSAGQKTVIVFADALLKKPIVGYLKGSRLGKVSKLITSPFLGKDGIIVPIQQYYLMLDYGKYKGQYVYIVASQVSKSKPA
jgi:hypothetical protein